MTDFDSICEILGELYLNYKEDEDLKDFMEFNDVGLPLAYLVAENLCKASNDGIKFITDTWLLFLQDLGLEDEGFETLDQILGNPDDIEQIEEVPFEEQHLIDIEVLDEDQK